MIRLLITSGRGPAECRIAVGHALERMAADAMVAGLDIDIVPGPQTSKHGPASVVVVIGGAGAGAFARPWVGSILWTAASPIRPHCKRKNWFIGVFELPAMASCSSVTLRPSDVRFETFRAGGPGGQHQNKTESAVRAVHVPSGTAVVARDGRSQHRNKTTAMERLQAVLDTAGQMAREGDGVLVHAGHDQLERGKPVRRFVGPRFAEV